MKFVIIIVTTLIFLIPTSVFAETEYTVFIEELPEWADHASNVMFESTKAWEKNNPGLIFYETENPQEANFRVQWVKEFGVEHIGYAYGNQFLEVGLGDSLCGDTWHPFSSNYVNAIMEHEIGHIMGLNHNLDDKNHIMYPIMLDWEYGLVENDFRLTTNYAEFIPFCTNKNTPVTIDIDSDESRYGFDVYVVPSIDALSAWEKGNPFEYFAGSGCFAKDVLNFKGICDDVGPNSGLLIMTGNKLSNPLVTFDVSYEMESNDLGMTIPVLFPGVTNIPIPVPAPIPEPTPEPTPTPEPEPEPTPEPEPEVVIIPESSPKPIPAIISNDFGSARIDTSEIKLLSGDSKELKIYGNVLFSNPRDRIAMVVTYPDGNSNGELLFPKNDGTFETRFTLNNDSPDGTYEIMITSKQKLIGFLHFTLSHEHILEQMLESPIISPNVDKPKIQKEEILVESKNDVSENILPPWIKNNAKWWADETIGDSEFISSVQYLIEKQIIKVKGISKSSPSQENIPMWIKNTAAWWADGKISENEFVQSLEFMVNTGIIPVNLDDKTIVFEKKFDFEENKNNIVTTLTELGKSSDFVISFDGDLSAKQNPPAKLHTYKITHTQDGHIGDLVFYEGSSSLFNESSFGKFSQIKIFLSNEYGLKPTSASTQIILDMSSELVDWGSLNQKTTLVDWILDTIEVIPREKNGDRVSVITNDDVELKLTSKDAGLGYVELLISKKLTP